MRKQGILITIILIVIVTVVGGFTIYRMKKNVITPVTNVSPSAAMPTAITPIPGVQVSAGTSDADLEKDTQGIDTQLKAINADATGIDQSLNDQQGNLSEQ
jgi:hypothetical protein